MIDVVEALRRIEESAIVLPPRRVRIEKSVGLKLQEDVISDADFSQRKCHEDLE